MSLASAHPYNEPEMISRGLMGAAADAWLLNTSYAIASGGLKSSLRGIYKFAKATLNFTLLAPATTRKWLRPTTLTPSHSYAAGGPWEIFRYTHPVTGRITDLYTKSGDAAAHGGIIALIPEYNAGFNVLCQAVDATIRTPPMLALIDHIALHLLPALETQAATEAAHNYAGVYKASDLDSSHTVAVGASTIPHAAGGLSITEWISNGTAMLKNPMMGFDSGYPKLLPTIQDVHASKEIAFYATSNVQTTSYQSTGKGPFVAWYEANFDWTGISQAAYGRVTVREFVFDLDASGRASKVRPVALRVELERES